MRIIAVRTGPHGRTVFGTIEKRDFKIAPTTKVVKEPGATAKPHNPKLGEPILLTIGAGSHRILVQGETGEESVDLTAGHQILFCDFPPGPGHWSQAGPQGAELLPAVVLETIDLDREDWEEGIFQTC